MEQPPAWLRHQAVLASARAMVSMTWKKVIGSVSIPFAERGSSRRNSRASWSLSRSAGGSRRLSSISSDAASTAGRNASARETTAGSPARSVEDGISVSKAILFELFCPSGCDDAQFLVDLLVRLALGLQPVEIINHPGHQETATEIKESRRNLGQRHVGLQVVAGPHDQRQADRAQDLADAAEAVGRAHAGGLEMRWPYLGRVGTDDGEAAIGEEHRRRQDQPESRQPEKHAHVVVAGQDDQDAGAEAQQAAAVAPCGWRCRAI